MLPGKIALSYKKIKQHIATANDRKETHSI